MSISSCSPSKILLNLEYYQINSTHAITSSEGEEHDLKVDAPINCTRLLYGLVGRMSTRNTPYVAQHGSGRE